MFDIFCYLMNAEITKSLLFLMQEISCLVIYISYEVYMRYYSVPIVKRIKQPGRKHFNSLQQFEGDRPRDKIFLNDKVVSANVVCRKAMVQKKRTHSLQKFESSFWLVVQSLLSSLRRFSFSV